MTTARDTILNRLRAAAVQPQELPPVPTDRETFADWPDGDAESLCTLFASRLEDLNGVVHRVPDKPAAAACLARLVPPGSRGLLQPDAWLCELAAMAPGLGDRLAPLPNTIDAPEMAAYDAGVTGADWLIARTGSIVISSDLGSGRRLSVLPPLHVVVATAGQVVPSLQQALAPLEGTDRAWSSSSLITGPSRTADIEKILVLGAHGPRRLEVVLIQAEHYSTGDPI